MCDVVCVARTVVCERVCVCVYAGVLCVRAQAAPVLVVWVRVARCAFFLLLFNFCLHFFSFVCDFVCVACARARAQAARVLVVYVRVASCDFFFDYLFLFFIIIV